MRIEYEDSGTPIILDEHVFFASDIFKGKCNGSASPNDNYQIRLCYEEDSNHLFLNVRYFHFDLNEGESRAVTFQTNETSDFTLSAAEILNLKRHLLSFVANDFRGEEGVTFKLKKPTPEESLGDATRTTSIQFNAPTHENLAKFRLQRESNEEA